MGTWKVFEGDIEITGIIDENGKATFPQNTDVKDKTYTITYKDGDIECSKDVIQQGTKCDYTYNKTSGNIPNTENNFIFGTFSSYTPEALRQSSVEAYEGADFVSNLRIDVDNLNVVGLVSQNTSTETRTIKYRIKSVNGSICADEEAVQGKGCDCSSFSVTAKSVAKDAGPYTFATYTSDQCITNVSATKTAEWITAIGVNASDKTITGTVTSNSDKDNRSASISVRGESGNQVCPLEFTLVQAGTGCDCQSLIFTNGKDFSKYDTEATLGTFTMKNGCDPNKVTAIKVSDSCESLPEEVRPYSAIKWETVGVKPISGGYALTAETTPSDIDIDCNIVFKVKYDNEECGEHTIKQRMECKCEYVDFFFGNVNRYPLANKDDESLQEWTVVLGYMFFKDPKYEACLDNDNIKFFSSNESIIKNIKLREEEMGIVHVEGTLLKVENPCKCTFGYKFYDLDGREVICEDKFEIKRACYCPTDDCVIYGVDDDPVYVHPLHVDYSYVGPSDDRKASPHGADTLLLSAPDRLVYKPNPSIGNGNVIRGGSITRWPSADENYQKCIVEGGVVVLAPDSGITLLNGDTIVFSGGTDSDGNPLGDDFQVVVQLTESNVEFEGETRLCKQLHYYASRNGSTKWRDRIMDFGVINTINPDSKVLLDCWCVDKGEDVDSDYRQGVPSCKDFTIVVRQASVGKKFRRYCVDYYTHDSGYEEIDANDTTKDCGDGEGQEPCLDCGDNAEWV